jgi:23S rRNA (uracil1939-C5)-methyltransferase
LESVAYGGECIAHVEGRVLFADYGIPGEEVTVQIYEDRKDYLRGRVTAVHDPSPDRRAAPCVYFGHCGGCQWQHVAYERQLVLKTEIVREQLRRIGHFEDADVRPCLASPEEWGYRNQVRFTAKRRGDLGYISRYEKRFFRVDECLIAAPFTNQVLQQLQGQGAGLHQLQVRTSAQTGDYLIQPAFDGVDLPFETGQASYTERLGGRDFVVSASSFFQVNVPQAEQLARLAIEGLRPKAGDVVVDAYAGVGTLAALVAPLVSRVIAIEEAPAAVADSRLNLAGLDNVQMVLGKVEDVLPQLEDDVDGVLLDPPRQGCFPQVLQAVIEKRPRNLVYVSCDPSTLARDLRVLVDGGFLLQSVQPLDMFPQTYHIECVATLRG